MSEQEQPIIAENELYTVQCIDDDFSYGLGLIEGEELSSRNVAHYAEAVLESLVTVSDEQLAFSGCTDGRSRLPFEDGSPAPVREKLVGADMVTAFHIAEDLGEAFYGAKDMPLAKRALFVATYLKSQGYMPSTHGPTCGAAAGYTSIVGNAPQLFEVAEYKNRHRQLMNGYDQDVHRQAISHHEALLQQGDYQNWSDSMITDAVLETSGQKGVKRLHSDQTDNHGHNEILIARLQVAGVAVDATLFASIMNGEQVFSVNDNRLETVIETMCKDVQNDTLVDRARHAGHDFQNAGHATLAKNMLTIIVAKK